MGFSLGGVGDFLGDVGSTVGDFAGDVVGGIQGLFKGPRTDQIDPNTEAFNIQGLADLQSQARGFRAPTIDPAAQAGPNAFAGQQSALIQQLQREAAGQGAAQQLIQRNLQDASGRAVAAQQSAAATARGNPALAQLTAAQQSANIGSGLAGQTAQAGLQAQLGAQQALGGALGQFGGQDLQRQLFNAGAINQRAGQQANLQQQAGQFGLQSQMGLAQAQQQAQQRAAELEAQRQLGVAAQPTGADKFLNLGATLGGALIASDRRLKTGVRSGESDVDDILDHLSPKTFSYKDEKFGKGQHVGIMAQDLERSKKGRLMVVDAPEGKGVDLTRLTPALAAGLARVHKRVSRLEKKKGKK